MKACVVLTVQVQKFRNLKTEIVMGKKLIYQSFQHFMTEQS